MQDLEDKLVKDFPHLKRATVQAAMSVIFGTLKEALFEDYKVLLTNFGRFQFKDVGIPGIPWNYDPDKPKTSRKLRWTASRNLVARAQIEYRERLKNG